MYKDKYNMNTHTNNKAFCIMLSYIVNKYSFKIRVDKKLGEKFFKKTTYISTVKIIQNVIIILKKMTRIFIVKTFIIMKMNGLKLIFFKN